jgi:predicted patatin/cPLA2 family phospholipase
MLTLGNRQLLITTTNSRDRKPYFLSPTGGSHQWRKLLKVSSALLFLYRQGAELTPWLNTQAANQVETSCDRYEVQPQADFYLDGGLAAPLPVREAYNRGARKVVIIRTVDAHFQAQSAWINKLGTLVCGSGYCPKTIDYLVQHEQAYRQELAFIANPPADLEIVQIFADKELQSKLLGSTDMDLRHDHRAGVEAGKALLEHENALNQNDEQDLLARDNMVISMF